MQPRSYSKWPIKVDLPESTWPITTTLISVFSEVELDICLYEMGGYLIAFNSEGESSLFSFAFFFGGSEGVD